MIKILFAIFITLLTLGASAQTEFVVPRDSPGRTSTLVRSAPTYVQARVLAAGVSETVTLPAGTRIAVFSATCNFYAKTGATAAVPAADIADGTASELNPTAWYYSNAATATQTVSVITPDPACVITIAAYKGRLD